MICTLRQRLAYAVGGLLVGDGLLLLYMLLAAHLGEPEREIAVALQRFTLYAIFSLVGWLLVGVPVALFLPVRSITKWPWPIAIAVGAFLGPLALVLILILL